MRHAFFKYTGIPAILVGIWKQPTAREMNKIFFATVFCLAWTAMAVRAADTETVYWLLAQEDGQSWCGFSDPEAFRRAIAIQKRSENAEATYYAGDVVDLTHQVSADNGDWVVIEKYAYAGGKLTLRRTNLLVLQNLEVIQETTIRGSTAEPFRIVSAATLDGKKATGENAAYPEVPVRTSLKDFAFLNVSKKMDASSTSVLCEKVN